MATMKKNKKKLDEEISFENEPSVETDEDLDKLGVILINDAIDRSTSDKVASNIIKLHYNPRFKDTIQLIITSPGGSYVHTKAIIDIMRFSRNKTRTIGLGELASGASMIFIAGHERIITNDTLVMFHNFYDVIGGKYNDLLSSRKLHDLYNEGIVRHIMKYSKLKTKEDVRKYIITDSDVWLTPEEMKEYGMCDIILDAPFHTLK